MGATIGGAPTRLDAGVEWFAKPSVTSCRPIRGVCDHLAAVATDPPGYIPGVIGSLE